MEILNLNLIPNGTNPVVHCSQYDEGRVFRFNLFNGSAVYVLDGTETIECDVKKPDGNIVTVAVPNTSDSYIDVTSTLQMCACSGNSLGTIKITKGGTELYTLNFLLSCERSPLENGIESDSAIHNLETQISNAVADQYDSNNVIFDNDPTTGHGIGYTVTSEGIKTAIDNAIGGLSIPEELNDLSDVNITSPTQGEALVFDADGNIVNGTVSTVGNLDDLSDVDTTGKATGDSLRFNGLEWVAQPIVYEMTQAEYDLINDFTPYANSLITIKDAPNLNATASDIEYSSGVSVADALDNALVKAFTITFESGISAPRSFGYYSDLCGFGFISAVIVPSSNIAGGSKLATFDTGKGSKQAKFDIIGIDGNGSGKGLFLNGDELYTNVNLSSGISVVICGTYR